MTAKKAAPLQAGLLSATKWGHGRVFQNRLDLSHHEERSCHADGIVRGRERFRMRQSFGDRWSGVKCDVKIGRVAKEVFGIGGARVFGPRQNQMADTRYGGEPDQKGSAVLVAHHPKNNDEASPMCWGPTLAPGRQVSRQGLHGLWIVSAVKKKVR